MDAIIELLRERNHFLEKFCDLNEKELVAFCEGNFNSLDRFYTSRERLLSIIGELDGMIERHCSTDFKEESTPGHKREIIRELDYKNELVSRILSQDLQALSFIESEKSSMIKELATLKTGKKAIGSYKTGPKKHNFSEKV